MRFVIILFFFKTVDLHISEFQLFSTFMLKKKNNNFPQGLVFWIVENNGKKNWNLILIKMHKFWKPDENYANKFQ